MDPSYFNVIETIYRVGLDNSEEGKANFRVTIFRAEGNNRLEKCKYLEAFECYQISLILSGIDQDDDDLPEIVHNA